MKVQYERRRVVAANQTGALKLFFSGSLVIAVLGILVIGLAGCLSPGPESEPSTVWTVVELAETPAEWSDFPSREEDCAVEQNIKEHHRDFSHYRSSFEEARKKEPDMADCWRVVEIGCGTACQEIFLVHPEEGFVLPVATASYGSQYRMDSRLILLNPPEHTGYDDPPDWLETKYYLLEKK